MTNISPYLGKIKLVSFFPLFALRFRLPFSKLKTEFIIAGTNEVSTSRIQTDRPRLALGRPVASHIWKDVKSFL